MARSVIAVLIALPSISSYNIATPARHPSRPAAAASRGAIVHLQERMPQDLTQPQAPQIISEETYGLMLSTLLKTEKSVKTEISANYAMVDYAFLQKLEEAIAEDDSEKAPKLAEIKEAVNEEMAKRMQMAAEALKDVLTSPTPVVMEGKIAGFARQGRIDDALLQLLEANLQQAEAAGAAGAGAVKVMSSLKERVQTELDAKLPPAMSLLRQLIRIDSAEARESLLREKMAPKKKASVILATGTGEEAEPESTAPDVPQREMAEAISELKSRFGNVDESYDTGFVAKVEQIAEEAEAVALDLAGGKELTAKQQQDLMWDRGTVSVWDLEAVEEEAHQDGKMAMWEEEAQKQFERQENAQRQQSIERDFT